MYKLSFNCKTLKHFTPAYTVYQFLWVAMFDNNHDLNICVGPNAQDMPQKLISPSVWLSHFTAAHDVRL